ncbi:MAG: toprim domain-containing protein [Acidimicrobiales bacterium]
MLYGLNWAKAEIVQADEAIVCEGYTDVIGFAKAGVGRAVATCGTALTDEHFRVLRSFARRIVLAFDADAAGQNAAERFYEWEQHHDVDVVVAALPAGVDPGTWPARTPPRSPLPSPTPCRSSSSGCGASWRRPRPPPPSSGRARRRRRSPWLPSTPAPWCATST